MTYKLRKLDKTSVNATEKKWLSQANKYPNIFFPTEIEKDFYWIRHVVEGKIDNGRIQYGMFKGVAKSADATIELVHTQKNASSAWLKMLEIDFSPELTAKAQAGDAEAIATVVAMYGDAVLGCIKLSGTAHKADTLKLYGRSDQLLKYFTYHVEVSKMTGVEITLEGRWLVFRPIK
jgi:hypothetical protein